MPLFATRRTDANCESKPSLPRKSSDRWRPSLTGLISVLAIAALLLSHQQAESAGDGAYDKDRPDPIKANGPIFVDWPKPDAILLFTGEMQGYLEPCGCAGLTNQKGGLKRRDTFLKQLKDDGWPVVALDAGGLIKRYGQQAQIKFGHAVDALIQLGYQGVGLGTLDLRMDLIGVAINLDEQKNPLTSANVGLFGFDETFSRRWRTVEQGGLKIGFTSVLTESEASRLSDNPDITIEPAAVALKKVTPEIANSGCDHRVLLVYGSAAEARELSKQFPEYGWVVSAVGADEPPHQIADIKESGAKLIEVGHKGMYAIAIGLYKSGEQPFRYQKVPLDHRFEDSEAMQQLLIEYQQTLKTMGLTGLGVKPQLHPNSQVSGGKFAGSAACADCHTSAYAEWEKTPHSHATQTLVDLDPPRHFDPECLSCHVTGWQPQKYFPYATGYQSLEKTPHLLANGCENCHGPAAEHVAVEMGEIDADEARTEALREALRLEIGENEGNKEGQKLGKAVNNCLQCHDLDNSPDFDFQKYWEDVKHSGLD